MKKFCVCLMTLMLCLCFAVQSRAVQEMPYDGYLVGISEELPLLFSEENGLQAVAPGVYRTDSAAVARALLRDGTAAYMEPDYMVSLFDADEESALQAVDGYDMLQIAYANRLGLDGTGVRIGVIDSGLDSENLNLQAANIQPGYDYIIGREEMSDNVGHGTRVAQVIVGSGANGAALGIAGAAELVPLRCFGSGVSTQISDVVQAIDDAVNVYNCDVINMSWGLKGDSETLRTAVENAADAGVILVAAAGNVIATAPQGTVMYPAAYDAVIGVGSVDSKLTVSPKSQQTEAVFTCAPGVNIPFVPTGGRGTVLDSGTSYASPCVAAMAALAKQASPNCSVAGMCEVLRERAADLGEPGYDVAYGHGMADAVTLFGSTWCRMEQTDGMVREAGWFRRDGGGTIVTAQYNEAGKLCGTQVRTTEKDLFGLTQQTPISGRISLFFLDHTWKPVGGSVLQGP